MAYGKIDPRIEASAEAQERLLRVELSTLRGAVDSALAGLADDLGRRLADIDRRLAALERGAP